MDYTRQTKSDKDNSLGKSCQASRNKISLLRKKLGYSALSPKIYMFLVKQVFFFFSVASVCAWQCPYLVLIGGQRCVVKTRALPLCSHNN